MAGIRKPARNPTPKKPNKKHPWRRNPWPTPKPEPKE